MQRSWSRPNGRLFGAASIDNICNVSHPGSLVSDHSCGSSTFCNSFGLREKLKLEAKDLYD